MKASDSSSDIDARRILLIGDISRAFLDADAVSKVSCEVCRDMPGAINAAAKANFRVIAVVMSGLSAKLNSALKVLRELNSDAKIVLLAQMYEEPSAMQLIGPVSNGAGVADDYLICPMHFSHLVSRILRLRSGQVSYLGGGVTTRGEQMIETAREVPVDAAREMKIRALESLATEDDLTGLKNRRYILEFSRQIIEHAREENRRVTLLLFDIDNLKSYNDVYGHLGGDEILKQVAALMRRCCRGHDVVGRIGGDEFAVVFWDDPQKKRLKEETERRSAQADHPKEAIFIARRFRRELEKAELGPHFAKESKMGTQLHLLGPQGKGVLTISGGLASFPRDGSTAEQLFQQADKALLEAKRSGKNRIYLVGRPKNDIANVE